MPSEYLVINAYAKYFQRCIHVNTNNNEWWTVRVSVLGWRQLQINGLIHRNKHLHAQENINETQN